MKKKEFLNRYKGLSFSFNGFSVRDGNIEVYFYGDGIWIHCLFDRLDIYYSLNDEEKAEDIVEIFKEIIFVNDRREELNLK